MRRFAVTLALAMAAAAGGGLEHPGAAVADTVTGTNTTQIQIRDQVTISSEIEIAVNGDGLVVTEVVVTVELSHTWLSDLRIAIVSPSGTEVLLFNRRGGSGDNLTDTRFDDAASLPIGAGTAPFSGSFRPEAPLAALAGEDGEGTWTLEIADLVVQDTGTLRSWSIEVTGDPAGGGGPVAHAGRDQSVCGGELVKLEGTASRGTSLTYAWAQLAGDPVTLLDPSAVTPTFTAPVPPLGGLTLTFQLTVADSHGAVATDTVNIAVIEANQAPVADAGPDQTVNEGARVRLDGTASFDPEGQPLVYLWVQTQGPAVVLEGSDGPTPEFAAPGVQNGEAVVLGFDLFVTDAPTTDLCGGPLAGASSVVVTVEDLNHPPVADAGPDQAAFSGDEVVLDGRASRDPDKHPLAFAWEQADGPAVDLAGADTPRPSFVAPLVPAGTSTILTFALTVGDGFEGGTATDVVQVVVQNQDAPPDCSMARPSLASLWPPNHKLVRVSILGVSDPDGDAVSIRVTGIFQDEPTSGLGDGDTALDGVIIPAGSAGSSGEIVLIRAERRGGGNGRVYTIRFEADDGQGGVCAGSVKVAVPPSKHGAAVDDGPAHDSTVP